MDESNASKAESIEETSLDENNREATDTVVKEDTVSIAPVSSVSLPPSTPTVVSSRRFLAAYITSILSAVSLLGSGAYLGYVLLDYFIAPKEDSWLYQYVDFAPLHLSIMTSMLVFGLLYLITSQYVAKQAAKDTVGLRDWRVYRVVYSAFTAVLLTVAASVLASLLYLPLATLLIADDLTSHQIMIQVFGGLHVLLWVGVLIWQERLVKNGKHSALQGVVTVVLALVLVLLTAIFPIGGETNKRYDKRAANDLLTIETAIETYKTKNDNKLPKSLSEVTFKDSTTVQKRIKDYKYTVKQSAAQQPSSSAASVYAQVMGEDASSDTYSTDSESSFDRYLSSLTEKTSQKYTLCATFRTDTTSVESSPIDTLLSSSTGSTSFNSHKKGEVCFDRT